MSSILLIRSEYKVNGPGMLAFYDAKGLQRYGHTVIFVSSGGELVETIEQAGFSHYTIPELASHMNRLLLLSKILMKLFPIIRKHFVEYIIGFNAASTFCAILAGKLAHKKCLAYNVVLGEGKEWFLHFLPCPLLAVSNYSKNRLIRKGIKEKKVLVIYPSTLDSDNFNYYVGAGKKFRQELNLNDRDILVGSVAMFNANPGHSKGQKSTVSIISKVLTANSTIKFVFVGDGPSRVVLEKSVHELGLSKQVKFVGTRRDVPEIMGALDIFCHYPDQETFGLVLIEAMSMKTPVVARRLGGMPEIVVNNETGFLVDDLDGYANKIIELSFDAGLRMRMGECGYHRAMKLFHLDHMIDQLLCTMGLKNYIVQ